MAKKKQNNWLKQYRMGGPAPIEKFGGDKVGYMNYIQDSLNGELAKKIPLKEYNKQNAIKLNKGNFRGANIDTQLIDDLHAAAVRKGIDPYTMYGVAGQESAMGGNGTQGANSQGVISGWDVASKYQPVSPEMFLAGKGAPVVRVDKSNYGIQGVYKNQDQANQYLNQHPEYIDQYRASQAKKLPQQQTSYTDLAAEYIKNKGVKGYNPGDKDYPNKVNKRIQELRSDPAFTGYLQKKGYTQPAVAINQYGGPANKQPIPTPQQKVKINRVAPPERLKDGGKTPAPIYVDSKNDPRYKRYQDSLDAYNTGEKYSRLNKLYGQQGTYYNTPHKPVGRVHKEGMSFGEENLPENYYSAEGLPIADINAYYNNENGSYKLQMDRGVSGMLPPDEGMRETKKWSRAFDKYKVQPESVTVVPDKEAYLFLPQYKKPVQQVVVGQPTQKLPTGYGQQLSPQQMQQVQVPSMPNIQNKEWYSNSQHVPIDAEDDVVQQLYNGDGSRKYQYGGWLGKYKNGGGVKADQRGATDNTANNLYQQNQLQQFYTNRAPESLPGQYIGIPAADPLMKGREYDREWAKQVQAYRAAQSAQGYEQAGLNAQGQPKAWRKTAEKLDPAAELAGKVVDAGTIAEIPGVARQLSKYIAKGIARPPINYIESNVLPHDPYSSVQLLQKKGINLPIDMNSYHVPATTDPKLMAKLTGKLEKDIPLTKEQQILQNHGLDPYKTKTPDTKYNPFSLDGNPIGPGEEKHAFDDVYDPLSLEGNPSLEDVFGYTAEEAKEIEEAARRSRYKYNGRKYNEKAFVTKGPHNMGESFRIGKGPLQFGEYPRTGDQQAILEIPYLDAEGHPSFAQGQSESVAEYHKMYPQQYPNKFPDQLAPSKRQQNKYGGKVKTKWLNKY